MESRLATDARQPIAANQSCGDGRLPPEKVSEVSLNMSITLNPFPFLALAPKGS